MQKLSVNTGNTCPNRDGTLGRGGCIYCNNLSFTPAYCFDGMSVARQIEAGKRFFGRKYRDMQFLAYFQSYTSTYATDTARFSAIISEALDIDRVVGIVIGTRPDCLDPETIDMLAAHNAEAPVFIELGIESLCDETLRLINRGHTARQSRQAIHQLVERSLHVGAHLIAGLPGESQQIMLDSILEVCDLGVESIKLHQLQILRDTPLHKLWETGQIKLHPWNLNDYLDFCVKVIETVPEEMCIERFLASAPPDMVVAPRWNIKNYEFVNKLNSLIS